VGYSKNPTAIERVEPLLELMFNSDSALEWETPDPQKLAYYLREGISAAAVVLTKDPTNEKMQNFVSLRGKYVIRIKGNKVVAELRNALPMAVAQVKKLRSVYLPDITTISEIVGAVAKYIVEEKKEQLTIPNYDLTEDDIQKLGLYLRGKSLTVTITEKDELVIGESDGDN
jgi:hypothetical protein